MSFEAPEYTANSDARGTLRILEAVRLLGLTNKTHIYQASTSELYGLVQEVLQKESTPLVSSQPLRPGQALRLLDHGELPRGLWHVSLQRHPVQPREPATWRNVRDPQDPRGLARIDAGLEQYLFMGNLDSLRDWGHARDYVEMQWRLLQQEQQDDFVIATGRQESVRRFIELAASELGWGGIEWQSKGLEETGSRADTTTPEELVAEMVAADRDDAKKAVFLKRKGFAVVGSMENPSTNPEAIKAAGGAT